MCQCHSNVKDILSIYKYHHIRISTHTIKFKDYYMMKGVTVKLSG